MKKVFAVVVAIILALSITTVAFAAPTNPGKITITNPDKGTTYEVYKIFAATVTSDGKGVAYKNDSGLDLSDTSTKKFFKAGNTENSVELVMNGTKAAALDADGNLSADAVAVIGAFLNQKKSGSAILKPIKTVVCSDANLNTSKQLVIEDLPYGLYYVKSSKKISDTETKSAVSITPSAYNAKIIDKKVTKPEPKSDDGKLKHVLVKDDQKLVPAKKPVTVAYGTTHTFSIDFVAVNFASETDDKGQTSVKQIKTYTIKDIPTGLKIDEASFAVKVDGKALAATDFTVVAEKNGQTPTGNYIITIKWADNENKVIYTSPADVSITYNALVNSVDGATNDVTASYTTVDGTQKDIYPEPPADPEHPTPHEPDVKLNCYKISVVTSNGTGANYQVIGSDGKPMYLVDLGSNTYRLATDEEIAKYNDPLVAAPDKPALIDTMKSDNPVIKGLGNGTYTIKQSKAPEGYNTMEPKTATINDKDATATFANTSGTVLPETGSTGTTLLIVIGSFIAICAGVFLVTNKRMSKEAI